MGQAYVSEFEEFIDHYMQEHPEEVVEQKAGWDSFWNVKVDPASLIVHREDVVRDDHYGFF